jgi:hypothetical protein
MKGIVICKGLLAACLLANANDGGCKLMATDMKVGVSLDVQGLTAANNSLRSNQLAIQLRRCRLCYGRGRGVTIRPRCRTALT